MPAIRQKLVAGAVIFVVNITVLSTKRSLLRLWCVFVLCCLEGS
jgi:hypothetical protein